MKNLFLYILMMIAYVPSALASNPFYRLLESTKAYCAYLACSAVVVSAASAIGRYIISKKNTEGLTEFTWSSSAAEYIRKQTAVAAFWGIIWGAVLGLLGYGVGCEIESDYALGAPLVIALAAGGVVYTNRKLLNPEPKDNLEIGLAAFLTVALSQYLGLLVAKRVA